MSVSSKVEICNLALSHVGDKGSVNDIDAPSSKTELVCAQWYDITRQQALRKLIPNFAMGRRLVAKKATAPPFGYKFAYEYPSDCLRVLGFGEIDEKRKDYNIEDSEDGMGQEIQLDDDFTAGLKLRFIKDIDNVSRFTPDFTVLLALMLAKNLALPLTQQRSIRNDIANMLPGEASEVSGVNAQENPPIRVSTSKYQQARLGNPIRNGSKR